MSDAGLQLVLIEFTRLREEMCRLSADSMPPEDEAYLAALIKEARLFLAIEKGDPDMSDFVRRQDLTRHASSQVVQDALLMPGRHDSGFTAELEDYTPKASPFSTMERPNVRMRVPVNPPEAKSRLGARAGFLLCLLATALILAGFRWLG